MKKPLSVSVVFTDDFIFDMSKHPADDSSHQMSLKWEVSNTNIGMPALSKKACKALKGFNHRLNSVQRENNYLGVTEKKNELKSRIKAEANILPYPSRCFESGAVASAAGGWGEESEQPDASAAATLRRLPEAGSSAHREVAPEETSYMTASLCSLLPRLIHVWDPPRCSREEECHVQIHPLLIGVAIKREGKSNPFS